MRIKKAIESLGYSTKEVELYLALLKMGGGFISDISSNLEWPRSSTTALVHSLSEKGVLNPVVMHGRKYWIAEKPEQLLKKLIATEEEIRMILPKLDKIRLQGLNTKRHLYDRSKSIKALKVVADSSPQPILITNDSTEIEYVNHAWQKQFGYSLKEVKGFTPKLFQTDETSPRVYQDMWEKLSKKRIFQSTAIIDKRKDGTHFNLMTTILPVVHDNYLFYIQILEEIRSQ